MCRLVRRVRTEFDRHLVPSIGLLLLGLPMWLLGEIAPAVWPAVDQALSRPLLFQLLAGSLGMNIVLLACVARLVQRVRCGSRDAAIAPCPPSNA